MKSSSSSSSLLLQQLLLLLTVVSDCHSFSVTTVTTSNHHKLEPPISMTELLTVHHNNNHNDKNVDNAELSQAQELYNNVVQTTYGYVCMYSVFVSESNALSGYVFSPITSSPIHTYYLLHIYICIDAIH